jgi:hypothetical protein
MIRRKKSFTQLTQLTQKETSELRIKYYKKQNKKCAVLGKIIPFDKCVLDHKHMTKKERKQKKHGVDGKGLCRGILHNQINGFEGKVLKQYKKQGLMDMIPLTVLLRRLAHFLDNPTIPQKYIHYSEKNEPKTFGKKEYNKIVKYYFKVHPKAKKIPDFPESGIKTNKKGKKKYKTKLTKKWIKILNDIEKEINNG